MNNQQYKELDDFVVKMIKSLYINMENECKNIKGKDGFTWKRFTDETPPINSYIYFFHKDIKEINVRYFYKDYIEHKNCENDCFWSPVYIPDFPFIEEKKRTIVEVELEDEKFWYSVKNDGLPDTNCLCVVCNDELFESPEIAKYNLDYGFDADFEVSHYVILPKVE